MKEAQDNNSQHRTLITRPYGSLKNVTLLMYFVLNYGKQNHKINKYKMNYRFWKQDKILIGGKKFPVGSSREKYLQIGKTSLNMGEWLSDKWC